MFITPYSVKSAVNFYALLWGEFYFAKLSTVQTYHAKYIYYIIKTNAAVFKIAYNIYIQQGIKLF